MTDLEIIKSGYAAIVGRPNVGKSTLLNALLGEKVSITSAKPQTTRCQILGIKTRAEAQIIYIDTPGLHQEEKRAINRYMNRVAQSVLQDADIIIFMIDATSWQQEDEVVLKKLESTHKPIILIINKIDLLPDKTKLLPLIEKMQHKLSFAQIIPVSAMKRQNLENLEQEIIKLLPEGPLLFPEDQLTDKNMRFQAAEIIREKLIRQTEQELPYATTVEIEQFKQRDELTEINAVIWVERPGQKIIVIGKGGLRLKRIGSEARRDIEKMTGNKVFLRLWVKVKAHWTDDDLTLRNLGYE